LIDRTPPEPTFLSNDADDLVELPDVAATEPGNEILAEFESPTHTCSYEARMIPCSKRIS
jgi:hypothetical protein